MTLASTFVTVTPKYFFVLGALLFTIGATGLLLRKNTIVMFMCVELMLNAVNLTFVSFSKALDDLGGQTAVFFVLVVAAADADRAMRSLQAAGETVFQLGRIESRAAGDAPVRLV